jgi:hypothetical protein
MNMDYGSFRKNTVINLVTIDVTEVPEEERSSFIKGMNSWVNRYKSLYNDLVIKSVRDSISTDVYKNIDEPKDLIILQGIRKETEEEFRSRIGIVDDKSWTVGYVKLTNCSAEEAKDEMMKMFKMGKPLTPEEWQKYKHNQVETFLNMEK